MSVADKELSYPKRRNCWEFMNCGREPGGVNTAKMGTCSAALPSRYDGVNKGHYAGRFCWVLSGLPAKADEQGAYARKLLSCVDCEFFKLIQEEEGGHFIMSPRAFAGRLPGRPSRGPDDAGRS